MSICRWLRVKFTTCRIQQGWGQWYVYRPQTKFAKVMFSQMSVCLSTGGSLPDTHSGRHLPCLMHAGIHSPQIRSASRRYASRWNAFLFIFTIRLFVSYSQSQDLCQVKKSHSASDCSFYTNLTCVLLLYISVHAPLDIWTSGESIEQDYIRNLKPQSYKQMTS